MTRRLLTMLGAILLLAVTALGGWLLTNTFQDSVSVGTGFDTCWRLEGTAVQIDCLANRFERGATRAVEGLNGSDRDDRLLAYVRAAEAEAAKDTRLAGSCHPAMHQLGRREGTRAAQADVVPAFPTGSSQLCTAGYVHGLAEGYLTGTPDAQVAKVFPALCHVTKAREGCAHGVGHALLRARATEAAPAATAGATRGCESLPGAFSTNCMSGVYMELAMRTRPEPVSPQEYIGACNATADVDRSLPCWGYLTLNLTSNDVPVEEVPTWCAQADLPGQFPCIEQYGRALGVEGVEACESVIDPKELRERCVDGAVGLQVGSGHVSKSDALDECDAISHKSLRAHCTRAVARYARGRKQVEAA